MNTIKDLALIWWYKECTKNKKCELTRKYYPRLEKDYGFNRCYLNLRSGYLENIFYNEVIVKWWDAKGLSKYLYDVTNINNRPAQLKEIYLKEHSKEEPALDFKYCKNEIEGGGKCTIQCDHCKEYYAPLEMEQPLSVNKNVEVDEKNKSDKEIIDIALGKFKNFGEQPKVEDNSWDDVEAEYINSTFYDMEHYNSAFLEFLQQHYTLTKKQ
jgi:hypothetical protein